jgi:micrococcal nuclease
MQLTNKYLIDKETLKRNCCITGTVILAAICVLIIILSLVKKTPEDYTESGQPSSGEASADEDGPIAESDPESNAPKAEPNFSTPPENRKVTRVSDGDTVYVEGFSTRTRLIGIDTPEVYNLDTAKYTCYGAEASDYLKNLLSGKKVGIETDTDAGELDAHGRPLVYIYYKGKNINYELVRLGYARENDYGESYKYKKEFVAAQEEAKQNQRGLWSPNTCNGN